MTDASPAAPVSPPVSPPAPWGLPLLGAAALLCAVPIGTTAFVWFAQSLRAFDDPYSSGDGAVRDAFAMGGWPMYAVLGAGVLASCAAAVFVVFAARQNALFALPLPLFAAVPAAVGAAGTSNGLAGSILAVAHASPVDRAVILAGSMGEALWCSTLGASVTVGLALSMVLALVLAGLAQRSRREVHARGLMLGAVVMGGLVVMAWLGATTTQTASSTWLAVAHSTRSFELMAAAAEELTRAQSHLAMAALAMLAAAVVLAALARGAPVGARVACVVSISFGVGLLFISARARPSKDVLEAFVSSAPMRELYVFDAPPADAVTGIPLGSEVNDRVETLVQQTRDLHEAAGDYGFDAIAFELQPDVSARALRSALEQAAKTGTREVMLLTGSPKTDTSLPPPFDSVARRQLGVKVRLLHRESDCPCQELTVEANGVRLGDESWAFGPLHDQYVERFAPVATLKLDDSLTVDLVLKTAVAALAHGHQFGVVLEGSLPGREVSSLFDVGAEPEPDLAEATLLDVKVVSGPLTAATLKQRVQLDRVARCVDESVSLPATVEFEVALGVTGGVLDTNLVGRDAFDEFGLCVTDLLTLETGGRVSGFTIARLKVKFTAPAKKK